MTEQTTLLDNISTLGASTSASGSQDLVFTMVTEDGWPTERARAAIQNWLAMETLKTRADAARVTALSAALTMVAEIEQKIADGEF